MNLFAGTPSRHRPPGRRARRIQLATAAAVALALAVPVLITNSPVMAASGKTPAANPLTVTQHPGSMMPTADGEPPAQLVIHTETKPGSASTAATATPTYAEHLVASGAVDPHLFNVTYLLAHHDTATVPVVVHYTPTMSTTAVAKAAAALPGASYLAGSATGHQATVKVDLASPGKFWSSVTRTPAADPATPTGRAWYGNPNAPQVLRDGITALSLVGAPQTTTQPARQSALTTPTYQLTINFHGFTDPNRWFSVSGCWAGSACLPTVIKYITGYAFGRTGAAAGTFFEPTSVACNQTATCDTLIITYELPAGSYQLNADGFGTSNGYEALIVCYLPQVNVDANRTIDLQADDSTLASPVTSKPIQPTGTNIAVTYETPDGTQAGDDINSYGRH